METRSQERKPAEVRRFEILYAAHQLFTERGYHSVSMEDVASRVGISKAGVYLYFPSKLKLFFGVIARGVDKLYEGLEKALTDPAHRTLIEKLDGAYDALQEYSPIFRMSQDLLSTGMPDDDFPPRLVAQFMSKMHSRREKMQEQFIKAFTDAQNDGEIRTDLDPSELAIVFGVYGMLMTRSEVPYQTAKEILLHGILSREKK